MKLDRPVMRSRWAVAVIGLTLLGFALRLPHLNEALYGDERWTYEIVTENGFADVVTAVHETAITPPLHYLLAWLTIQMGDSTVLVRLPSLVFGTATIPLTYLLAGRTVGKKAGLVGAGLIACSPFAVFYSSEARAYATMVFLVALSTLALLYALNGGRRAWWVVYATSACAALYSHYSAVFVVVAQVAWAFWSHRSEIRALVLANAVVVLGCLPWLPAWLDQRENKYVEAIGQLYPLSLDRTFEYPLRLMAGHPFLDLETMPGRASLVLLAAVAAMGLGSVVIRRRRRPSKQRWAAHPCLVLVGILALATPLGLLANGIWGPSLYAPRNLNASMPFIAIVIASALMSLGRRVSIAAAGLALAAFGLAAIRSLDVDYQRPDYRQVARFIDKTAGPGDPVITQDPSAWRIYSDKKPKVFEGDRDEDEAWKSAAAGKSVFVVRGQLESGLPLLGGPRGRVALREARRYRGLVPLAVGRYAGDVRVTLVRHDGRERLLLSGGRSIEVSAASARGFVDEISLDGKLLNVLGWATDPNGHAADQVLLFSGRRLIAAGSVNRFRKDVAEALGNDAVLSGFLLTVPARLVNISRVSVVTLIGHRAGELNLGESAIRHD